MPGLREKSDILVVDDKPDNLLALEVTLEPLGQNVVLARSGREALREILRREFAVILLDINMPTMDGFETAQLIRRHRASRHTPIIFVTANSEDLYLERSYALGAVDYILTPVIPDVLRGKVSVFVELFEKTREIRRQAESLERQTTRLRRLTSASLSINSARSLEAMLRAISDAARDVLGAREATTSTTLDRPNDRATRAASSSSRSDAPWPDSSPERSIVVSLVATDGRPMGSIEVRDAREVDFGHDDEAILAQLAQLASIAIQNYLSAEEREANRLKDEFLATLSHELRTPLGAILGWTRLLRAGHVQGDSAAHALAVIERNAIAQTRLIDELLDLSRIVTGTLAIEPRPLSLAQVVIAACDALRPAAEAKHVRLTTSLDGECRVSGDPDRLHQVVSNLLANALKFTPKGGNIEVRLHAVGDEVELEVRDDGEGIAPDFLPFVFDRFRQGDSTSKRSQGGLGLGLSLVRHIAERHGGSVRAASAGKGRGSSFVVRLPAELMPAVPTRRTPTSFSPREHDTGSHPVTTGRTLEGLCVLVVEDNADTREILREILRGHAAEVTAVASVREALAAMETRRPHVLVSDLAMPDEDGYDLIRRIRARAPDEGGKLPALALTAYARPEDREKVLSAGFQMHAAKPIKPAELVAAVAALADTE